VEKNKYLKLAHYLSKNRLDWSDGCSYAQEGLENWINETSFDEEIYKEISGLISNWDNDGRVFRDCEHNYDSLFTFVKSTYPDLYEVYTKLMSLVDIDV
jgi:hypothetical protein